ncbi:ABC transporter ATP-binding protein [Williamsia sp. CHRR-6]|uniref:ABC transporter ATP-binding protein n=1 Tax=Williamsia sp. CHRR-6 TaxID=2835871 RepID=UPI001BDB2758|nr:ABC transporter ATP-binding protein [Williamsia sp. CHRR-6]MBT0566018.1 ABC transporter ATP-binding protein [Williamsia sp. CHRR-6]
MTRADGAILGSGTSGSRRGALLTLFSDLVGPHRGAVAAIMVLQIAATVTGLLLPLLGALIIDHGVAVGDTGYIGRYGLVMVVVTALAALLSVAAVWLSARVSLRMARELRGWVFRRVHALSAREFGRFGTAGLITRTTNDVEQFGVFVHIGLSIFVTAPILGLGGLAMALYQGAKLAWVIAICIPVLFVTIGVIARKMMPEFSRMQTRIDAVNQIVREQITGVRVIRAYVREDGEQQRFAITNDELTNSTLRVGRLNALLYPTVMIIINSATVAVVWFAAPMVQSGSIGIGDLTAFLSYLLMVLIAVLIVSALVVVYPRAAVCSERILEVLDTESSTTDTRYSTLAGDHRSPPVVALRHVTVHLEGAELPILDDVSMTARPGELTAIVGGTGSGKSTLLALIPRLMSATDGAVFVAGVDVRGRRGDDLRRRIGYVAQQPDLLAGTIASALRFGAPEASVAQMWDALEVAQLADFVRADPKGLDAEVSQGGGNLSGGQRQRLAIARALIRRPPIYLFDDCFSALDSRTEEAVRAGLRTRLAGATVIMVTQRISTIADADHIVVLEAGRVVGTGVHQALLRSCPEYAELAMSQISSREWA